MVRSRHRLFLALELPVALRNRLAECARELAAEFPELRATAEADLHLTLVFLGERSPASALAVAERLAELSWAGPVRLQIRGLGVFPSRGAPRVVWAGVEDPSGRAAALQRSLAESMQDLLGLAPEPSWLPHVTLARPRRGHGLEGLRARLDCLGASVGPWRVAIGEVVLFESRPELRVRGAGSDSRYRAVARRGLDG
jgi:2'-5' RNA ligase